MNFVHLKLKLFFGSLWKPFKFYDIRFVTSIYSNLRFLKVISDIYLFLFLDYESLILDFLNWWLLIHLILLLIQLRSIYYQTILSQLHFKLVKLWRLYFYLVVVLIQNRLYWHILLFIYSIFLEYTTVLYRRLLHYCAAIMLYRIL